MKGRVFKTIVFFGKNFAVQDFIKGSFGKYSIIKVFQTSEPDEMDQILHQSNLTAIMINDRMYANVLQGMDILSLKEAGVRTYFLDDAGILSNEDITELSLNRISTLPRIKKNELKTKLEMFMLGKLQLEVHKDLDGNEIIQKDVYPRPSYFTHFKLNDGLWETVVSTHEQERDIEILFNRSWTVYCIELLKRASEIREVENDPGFSQLYHGIIFPNQEQKTLSVIHIKKDLKHFDVLKQKAIEFLSRI